jgi:hypothetical protein
MRQIKLTKSLVLSRAFQFCFKVSISWSISTYILKEKYYRKTCHMHCKIQILSCHFNKAKMHILCSRKFDKYTVNCFVGKTAIVMHTEQSQLHQCFNANENWLLLHAAFARRWKIWTRIHHHPQHQQTQFGFRTQVTCEDEWGDMDSFFLMKDWIQKT